MRLTEAIEAADAATAAAAAAAAAAAPKPVKKQCWEQVRLHSALTDFAAAQEGAGRQIRFCEYTPVQETSEVKGASGKREHTKKSVTRCMKLGLRCGTPADDSDSFMSRFLQFLPSFFQHYFIKLYLYDTYRKQKLNAQVGDLIILQDYAEVGVIRSRTSPSDC